MRLVATNGERSAPKVWLTDPEIEQLQRAAASYRDDIIIQLGAYVGLRAFEIPQIQPRHVKRTKTETGSQTRRLRVPRGKDTTSSGGKPRDAFLPKDVEMALDRYAKRENVAPRESFIDLTERGVRAVVKRTAGAAAEETADPDYHHVSSHDLRRRFAQRLLVDNDVNPRVVMQVGGWDSFQAIEPYLNEPTPDVVEDAFSEAGLV
jgi:integrase